LHGGTSEELRRYRVSANVPIEFQLPNMSGRLAITVRPCTDVVACERRVMVALTGRIRTFKTGVVGGIKKN
jgi:hypothetical protein